MINLGIIDSENITGTKSLSFIDYAYVHLYQFRFLYLAVNGKIFQSDSNDFDNLSEYEDSDFYFAGSDSLNNDIEIAFKDGVCDLYLPQNYRVSPMTNEFFPFAEEYNYDVNENKYNSIILDKAVVKDFFYNPPLHIFNMSGASRMIPSHLLQ